MVNACEFIPVVTNGFDPVEYCRCADLTLYHLSLWPMVLTVKIFVTVLYVYVAPPLMGVVNGMNARAAC